MHTPTVVRASRMSRAAASQVRGNLTIASALFHLADGRDGVIDTKVLAR